MIIPELAINPGEDLRSRYHEEIDWIKQCHTQGSIIATACTGALLLAETGLLDGHEATSHWAVTDFLSQQFPNTKVNEKLSLLITGNRHQIIMAGGATTFFDLGIYLITRFLGIEQAMRTAKIWLIDWHDIGQQPYASLARKRQVEDKVIAQCQQWIAMNYETENPVKTMTEMSGLSERAFKRRFNQATVMSPLDYVHTLRIEEAKQVLETAQTPIEKIAYDMGYEDSSFFRRLFKRKVGLTPQQYRKRFGTMRKNLLEKMKP